MAKAKNKKQPLQQGPYLAAALIAEKVLTEADNVATIIRVVDKVGLTMNEAHKKDSVVGIPLALWISFRAGGFSGRAHMVIVQRGPSGASEPIGASEILFNGQQAHAFNVTMYPLVLQWDGDGLYWYEIFLNNKFCTKIPLTIETPKAQPAPPPAKAKPSEAKTQIRK